jgi:Ni,Fe-hydrogenase III large subunit/Ni,Fe-hydrogenase III component G
MSAHWELPESIFEKLKGLGAEVRFCGRGRLEILVSRENIVEAARALIVEGSFCLALMVGNDRCGDRGCFEIHYVFLHPDEKEFMEMVIEIPRDDLHYPSLATTSYPASRYEREIRDLFGIIPDGHPDSMPLVRHGFWPEEYFPLRKQAEAPGEFVDDGSPFPFRQVEGEGVYEIPVGPVHAGIIEPGHFRFSVDGETIIEMRSRLYFTHKGTEKLFEGRSSAGGVELAERVSGDTSIGHSLAYCLALESLAGMDVPPKAQFWRVILLELERLYNHVGDFGAIANDTGFAFAHAHAFRIRERLLRLNKKLTGHRLLRGVLEPGGVNRDFPAGVNLNSELNEVLQDFDEIVELCWNNSMLRDRLRGTGKLTLQTAVDHGVLGYVARASGIDRDVRRDHPFAAYGTMRFRVPVFTDGDVEARTMVRVEEIRESVGLIRQAAERMPEGNHCARLSPLPAWQPAIGMVEAWRGAVLHWIMADERGALYRVKIQDPSFVNWPALSFALLKNIVPDFPLCNKSFNLSYSGNDL